MERLTPGRHVRQATSKTQRRRNRRRLAQNAARACLSPLAEAPRCRAPRRAPGRQRACARCPPRAACSRRRQSPARARVPVAAWAVPKSRQVRAALRRRLPWSHHPAWPRPAWPPAGEAPPRAPLSNAVRERRVSFTPETLDGRRHGRAGATRAHGRAPQAQQPQRTQALQRGRSFSCVGGGVSPGNTADQFSERYDLPASVATHPIRRPRPPERVQSAPRVQARNGARRASAGGAAVAAADVRSNRRAKGKLACAP
jgi:hypothetical protein